MALVHDAKKEIHAKIVYYGPGRSGKTTNLEFIYNKLKPEYRGAFKFMNTPHGRMVFFDFMRPELAGIKDYTIHFHLYTVPGDAASAALWKNVLKGLDGIVFVADLDPSRTLENRRSLESLQEYLGDYGKRLEDIPCMFQCNKRDVPGALSPEEMKSLLDTKDLPIVPASAQAGEGILPTLSEMVKKVLQKLQDLPLGGEEEMPEAAGELAPASVSASIAEPPPLPEELAAPAEDTSVWAAAPVDLSDEVPQADTVSDEEPMTLSDVEGELAAYPDVLPSTLDESEALADASEDFVESEPAGNEFTLSESEISLGGEESPSLDMSAPVAFSESVQERSDDLGEPSVALGGPFEALGRGRFRLPLVVRYGEREKRIALALTLSLE